MKTVTVIGLGYVGLPVACLCAYKYNVIGADIDKNKIALIKQGLCPIKDENLENQFKKVKGKIKVTTNIEEGVSQSDIIIICVPTPVDKNHSPDLTALKSAVTFVSNAMKENTLIIIESTIFPGTTEEVIFPILKKSNTKKFYLAHCPERIDPGNNNFTIEKIPRVVGGLNKESATKAYEFYKGIINADIVELSSVKAAEATKIMENTFRDINIAFINEMAMSFDKAGIDILEVIKGASTKPFAFMPHYPGSGVGGHCFNKKSQIFLKNSGHLKIKSIGSYIDSLDCEKQIVNDSEIFYPQNTKVLSFDMIKNKTSFKPVKIASKRKANDLLKIQCCYNYNLEVTELHPVIVYDSGLKVKLAKDIASGDKLVLNKLLPAEKSQIKIDMVNYLDKELIKKIRVKPKKTSFVKLKRIIDKNLEGDKSDYYRNNSIPLRKYLQIEEVLNIKREDIFLCTGRGPSFKKFPAILDIGKDFLRLVGYYLSEGCITKDKSLRTRFTFNKNEKEYIKDLKQIIKKFDLDYSVYLSKRFDSYTIKVSSNLFGFLLKDILKCGTNCYNMQIPELFFDIQKQLKEELLKGMFRGDGGVSWYFGKRKYMKNNKLYKHSNNSIEISYFTSSKVLFQQLVLFLLNLDIVPRLAKRDGYLTILGLKDVLKLKNWFLGEKRNKVNNYLKNLQKVINYRTVKIYRDFITIEVKKIEKVKVDYVYSFEVEDTNTLVTSNGVIAHNCIPVDPYYLIEKAKQIGFNHDFLSLARKINESMPSYAVELLENELKKINKQIKKAKIGILGISYKADVDDTRGSPALKIMNILKAKGADAFIFDPYVKKESNVKDLNELWQKSDYIILATGNKEFKDINPVKLKDNNINIIIDGRNCLDKEKIKNLGISYHGIGRN